MPKTIITSPEEVRAIFNAYVLPRVLTGEPSDLVQDSAAAHPSSEQPPRTSSERVVYYDGGQPVAVAHRFVTPDGTMGGSGRPDPKAVLLGNNWLIVGPD